MIWKNHTYVSLVFILCLSVLLPAACSNGNGGDKPAAAPAGKEPSASTKPASVPLALTLYGGSPGGFFTLVGEGLGNIIRKNVADSQFNYEPGNPVANILNVSSGKNPLGLGFAQNFEIKLGLNGVAPFKEKVPGVSAVGTMYDNAIYQLIVSKDFADKYGIHSLEDIAAKKPPLRITVLPRGNLVENINRAVLESYGITYADIEKWGGKVFFENINSSVGMIKDNKLDMFGATVFAPDSKILELASSKPIMLMNLNKQAQKVLADDFGLPEAVLPAKTYEWQNEDIQTISSSLVVMASKSMSNETAYTIAKTMVENIDKLKALAPTMKGLTPQIMANVNPAKLHPGAEKYYKEKGIVK